MADVLDDVEDIIWKLKQGPQDMKVLMHFNGQLYPINTISSTYVLPDKNWTGDDCFSEVEEDTEGAIHVITID